VKLPEIKLVPFGEVDPIVLDALEAHLEDAFGRGVRIENTIELPSEAYQGQRQQYQASAFLAMLAPGDKHTKLLGIADVDLYAPGLNFVFGEADPVAGRAVISLCRLRQEYYGLPGDNQLFLDRSIKEAIHELGHVYGLGHCSDSRCVMHFSNSLSDTDRKQSMFCPDCSKKLQMVIRKKYSNNS
jgi:archaemetzincin